MFFKKKFTCTLSLLVIASFAAPASYARVERQDFLKTFKTQVEDNSDSLIFLSPAEQSNGSNDSTFREPQNNETPPEIIYDVSRLPAPVAAMRERILEAAKSGDIEKLRPLLETGTDETQIRLVDDEENDDPVAFLKSISGDGEGLEVLAILVDLLNTGYVHLDAGTDNEIYAWPYFFAFPLEKLTKPQMVEAYQIMTSGDFEAMKEVGAYVFFRIGISPDGKWRFFLTGD